MPGSDREQQFLKAEHLVELHSAELKKELRLGDLVLSQILYIAGLNYFGAAGRLGSSHVMYWIPAVLLFYIPSGIVVVHLNREMPLEGLGGHLKTGHRGSPQNRPTGRSQDLRLLYRV